VRSELLDKEAKYKHNGDKDNVTEEVKEGLVPRLLEELRTDCAFDIIESEGWRQKS